MAPTQLWDLYPKSNFESVGIKKVEILLDLLGVEFALRPKGRPKTLEELQNER